MPELKIERNQIMPMNCMYCGSLATHRRVIPVKHQPMTHGGGADVIPGPSGDDPVSAVFGLLLLPFLLWDLLKSLFRVIGMRRQQTPVPANIPKPIETAVTVTTCERHRQERRRFAVAGVGMALFLIAHWCWAIAITRRDMGTDHVDLAVGLILSAILMSVLLPIGLSLWYCFGGPVIVERVTDQDVILDRVRQAYFEATGIPPHELG